MILLPLLFCLPYLLATPVLDSTVEPTSHGSTSPPDAKFSTGPVASTEIKMYKAIDPVESNNHTPTTSINKTPNEKTVQDGDFSSPECIEGVEERPPHRHFSKLVCFIILWVLGVTVALFLGLTICLGVRLSAQRERDRRGSGEQPREAAKGDDLENLWVSHRSSVEEQVEFWYANSTMVGQESSAERPRQTEDHGSRQRREGKKEREDESLWPKVTQKDITDFWYANGRPFAEEPQNQTLV